jgi:cation diffusion facilitator CzcD-associated flavoprotein CzcO
MLQPERFDVLVLGSGTGGKLIAWHMARSCQRTAVVERRWIGVPHRSLEHVTSETECRSCFPCPNFGCHAAARLLCFAFGRPRLSSR